MTEHAFDRFPSVSEEEKRQSLQELEGQAWGEASYPSYLVRTCHALLLLPFVLPGFQYSSFYRLFFRSLYSRLAR